MATAWGGADPIEAVDAGDYELGTEFLVNQDLTITHVRVWTGSGEVSVSSRKGRVWTVGGGQLGIATLSDDLPDGWSQYALDTPVERLAGTRFVVSYSTGGNYAVLVDALAGAGVDSGDGALTALGTASATNGNGVFNSTPGSFPATSPASHPFYGADVAYTLGVGGDTAPVITSATVNLSGATATAQVVATDAETLVGAQYRYDWGDGSSPTSSSSSVASHTYTASGLYGVLLSVTDADGLSDFYAVPVQVFVDPGVATGISVSSILDSVVSHALRLGLFESVNTHEPKSSPGDGVRVAIWADRVEPIRSSGLDTVSVMITLKLRIYTSMLQEPQDEIDPAILRAVDALCAAYVGDFDLGGTVRSVDIFGIHGPGLGAQAGYVKQDKLLLRVMTVTLPLLVNDVWQEVQ